MCGILGGFWQVADRLLEVRMRSALLMMQERGPNHQDLHVRNYGDSVVLLGHTRLSVIDLSDNGNQPMLSIDGRYEVVFNGEIYNFIELRKELRSLGRVFRTGSDTEVLLQAWQVWGVGALRRFRGMFAFAIFDSLDRTFTIVRDAFGIKPLYYSFKNGTFSFASDIRAMQAIAIGKSPINLQRSYDYLVHAQYDFGNETFFEDFRVLEPGALAVFNLDSLVLSKSHKWWSPNPEQKINLSIDAAAEELKNIFLLNIKENMRSDVPLGVTLSGGIDSSAIVCAMRYLEPDIPIHTFSYIAGDSKLSEEFWVDRVNSFTNSIPHKVYASNHELKTDLGDLIRIQGEPFGSTSIYAQYQVFKMVRDHGVVVTLDGQGADELCGGYSGYLGYRFQSLVDKGQYLNALTFFAAWGLWPNRSYFEGLKRIIDRLSSRKVQSLFRELNGMQACPGWINSEILSGLGVQLTYPHLLFQSSSGRRLTSFLAHSLTDRGLPGLLRHGDRNSMHFSVESRVPFLTIDMAEYMLAQPEDYLVSPKGETKFLLRQAMRGIVPDDILTRKDKIGFATPEKEWILAMVDTVREWLSEDVGLPFLNQGKICKEFELIIAGKKPYSWQVWRWVNYIQWYKGLS